MERLHKNSAKHRMELDVSGYIRHFRLRSEYSDGDGKNVVFQEPRTGETGKRVYSAAVIEITSKKQHDYLYLNSFQRNVANIVSERSLAIGHRIKRFMLENRHRSHKLAKSGCADD